MEHKIDQVIEFGIHYFDEQVLLWREDDGRIEVLVGLGARQWTLNPKRTTVGELKASGEDYCPLLEEWPNETPVHLYSCYPTEGDPEGFHATIIPAH